MGDRPSRINENKLLSWHKSSNQYRKETRSPNHSNKSWEEKSTFPRKTKAYQHYIKPCRAPKYQNYPNAFPNVKNPNSFQKTAKKGEPKIITLGVDSEEIENPVVNTTPTKRKPQKRHHPNAPFIAPTDPSGIPYQFSQKTSNRSFPFPHSPPVFRIVTKKTESFHGS